MTEVDERRAARTALRDQMANGDTRPPTGEQSSVSPESLAETSRRVATMVGAGPAGLSPELLKSVQAATRPPVAPGQERTGETSGVRNESSRFEPGKNNGTGKSTPER
ncbi:hypothetical protein ACWF0M_34380 [Kribbella sp. NPDC055110]